MNWEYRVQRFIGGFPEDKIEAMLNSLGSNGWEVVATAPRQNADDVWLILKRPNAPPAPKPPIKIGHLHYDP